VVSDWPKSCGMGTGVGPHLGRGSLVSAVQLRCISGLRRQSLQLGREVFKEVWGKVLVKSCSKDPASKTSVQGKSGHRLCTSLYHPLQPHHIHGGVDVRASIVSAGALHHPYIISLARRRCRDAALPSADLLSDCPAVTAHAARLLLFAWRRVEVWSLVAS
jgi:hypothetical protein